MANWFKRLIYILIYLRCNKNHRRSTPFPGSTFDTCVINWLKDKRLLVSACHSCWVNSSFAGVHVIRHLILLKVLWYIYPYVSVCRKKKFKNVQDGYSSIAIFTSCSQCLQTFTICPRTGGQVQYRIVVQSRPYSQAMFFFFFLFFFFICFFFCGSSNYILCKTDLKKYSFWYTKVF